VNLMQLERKQSDNRPRRVLLIGWDAADWQLIQPLIEKGLMPTTAALLDRGAWGNLATTRPILSPMLWNTIATGKRPQQHGVYGFTEPNADATGIQPVSSTSRKCKAIWNILTQSGLRSNVVGWYASHPAEPIAGVMVSNQFEQLRMEGGQPSATAAASIHPESMRAELESLRVLPSEIDASAILPFIPDAARLIQQKGHRVGKLQQMLAQTATIHAVATHLMANTDWDFTALYYEGIDRFGHEFMAFHPPKLEQVSQEDFDAYQNCMVGICRFHDMLLETLLTLAGDDTAVILMSDHGYYNDHLRPDPREGHSGPVEWHRPFGILAACGPGFCPGSRLYGASILDVAPTVLHLLGLPAAYDMPGRVLAEVLSETAAIDRVESWEEIDGDSGMHPASLRVDPADARAVLDQLVALGYVDAPSADVEKTVQQTIECNQLSLAQSLADSGEFAGAIAIIEQLSAEVRSDSGTQILLASCLLGIGDKQRARGVLQQLANSHPELPRTHMMLGVLELADDNPQAALDHLQIVAAAEPRLPNLHNKLGEVYLMMERYEDAIAAFERALTIDGESPVALAGLARAQLESGDPQQALDHALVAAELVHYFPRVHLTIGRAHLALGDSQGAMEALELCVKQAPKLADAHKCLARAYRNLGLSDKATAAELRSRGTLA
jgi:predicted AlkP superfamily phosphohydrolase/phosphomutase/tetratricopeptide (TPR) repeat protein